ncbi:NEDD8-activating enzyme E1 regulatory subunit [Blyttiomyces sp. JEL0837]|nr:NEDD8-activating enzyme E1 regulatory subunit [Blyttiomyces sp. JEL0837]
MQVDKTKRYDRQLRLWQAHGQEALETSHICLLNATATGTEILKNLVLPGIGAFTILDNHVVTGADIGSNFFLTPDSLGQLRGRCCTELLAELNEEVAAHHVDEKPEDVIESKPSFFKQFSLVICNQLNERSTAKLADICWDLEIPLVVVKVNGLYSYIRLSVAEHPVVETHPDQFFDLRLDSPFADLSRFAQSFDLEKLDGAKKSHVPYIVILLKALERWRDQHKTDLPSTSRERDDFKKIIKGFGMGMDDENFEEALAASYRACTKTKIPSHVNDILRDEKTAVNEKSTKFWFIARAVRDFVDNEGQGCLPLPGGLPDMKADTDSYIQLQTLYRKKAVEDKSNVQKRVANLLASCGKPTDWISTEEIDRFCKNSSLLKLIRYRSLSEELSLQPAKNAEIGRWLEDIDNNFKYYILFRAAEKFNETHQRYPGLNNEDVDVDIGLLKKCVVSLLNSIQVSASVISDDIIHEFVRAGGSELHSMASLTGGIASQEIIKLLTRQYVPIDNLRFSLLLASTMNFLASSSRAVSTSTKRSFYTWHIPKAAPRTKLDDGSVLIDIRKPFDTITKESELPPRLRTYPKRSWLSPEQIAEARQLRTEDPDTWTVQALARKYNTFPGFIMRIADCPPERKEMLQRQRQESFDRLPISKKVTLIDRVACEDAKGQ